MAIPVFPLPGAYLFPGAFLPLHVFEPRYRQMVEDLLDGPGRIVLAAISEGQESEEAPPLEPVAGLGEIVRHEKLPDGRYMVVLLGLARVAIDEVPSEEPYRLVEHEPLVEAAPDDDEAQRLGEALQNAIRDRSENEFDLEGVELRVLTDLLLMQLTLPRPVLQRLFSEPDLAVRARGVLIEHTPTKE